jgi:hypothetical protein
LIKSGIGLYVELSLEILGRDEHLNKMGLKGI